jgi:type II secretory pathway component PulC
VKATAPVLKLSKAVAVSNNKIDWQIPTPYPATLRDPMQFGSATATQAGTGRLTVKGIVLSGDKSSAIIDNQIVREGEEILGATVVKINKDSVEFEKNGKSWKQRVQ